MLKEDEVSFIFENACIPEHIPIYFSSISKMEPFLFNNYLCYRGDGTIVIIGYPFKENFNEKKLIDVMKNIIAKSNPNKLAIIAPRLPTSSFYNITSVKRDFYYKLDISSLILNKKLRNLLKRASKELTIEVGRTFPKEGEKLILEFCRRKDVNSYMKFICKELPNYVSSSATALVLSTYNKKGNLVAFDIAEFWSKEYVFYMFNFMTRKENYVPGASDLLLYELIKKARSTGKDKINMGLGINDRVTKFKLKWGSKKFLPYEYGVYQPLIAIIELLRAIS